jgi:putative ABC transport system substrate-binding protein
MPHLIFLLLLALLLTAAPGESAAEDSRRIVVLESGSAAPYQEAIEGFRAALPDGVEVYPEKISGPPAETVERVHAHRPDLVVAVGSKAAAWAIVNTRSVPVVFLMVLNPVASGLVASLEQPGERVTGAALDIPLSAQFEVLRQVLRAKRVAVLSDPGQSGSLIDEARRVAGRNGIELTAIPVNDPKDLDAALERVRGFDALWAIADRTVLARKGAERILLDTLENRIPFMGLSEQYVRAGALLGLSSSYHENGRQGARIAARLLAGEAPSDVPVALPEEIRIHYNERTARRLGIDLSPEALDRMTPVP